MSHVDTSSPDQVAKRLRARASNELLLLKNLSDNDARVASVIINHIADVIEGKPEPKLERPVIRKLAHI